MKKLLVLFLALVCLSHFPVMGQQITWSAPSSPISSSGVDASNPQTVIDVNGNATSVWLENGVVKASSLPFGGSWSAATSISGSGSSLPSLGIDGSGNVTALWLQNGAVTSATLPSGGSWSAATTVSSTTAATPQLSVDNAGNAVAIWTRSGFIESATKLAGGSWSSVHVLSSNGADDAPQVSIGANGTVVAVWHQFISASSSHGIFSATAQVSGSWQTAVSVIPVAAAFTHHYPQVAVDTNGNAVLVWFRYTTSGTQFNNVTLISSTLTAGASTWALPTIITFDLNERNPTTLSLRVLFDGNRNAIASWNPSNDGARFNIETAVMQNGGSWSNFAQIIGLDLYGLSSTMALDPNGNALSVFMANNLGTGAAIWSAESYLGAIFPNGWTPAQALSTGSDNGFPSAARSLNGSSVNAVAVWVTNDGTNNRIVASTGTSTLLGAPSNVAVTQSSTNFGAFTDFFNTISWTLSTDPNVGGYAVYRDGVLFAQLASTDTQVIDHNQVQNGSVTYGVAAFDNTFQQSITITQSFP